MSSDTPVEMGGHTPPISPDVLSGRHLVRIDLTRAGLWFGTILALVGAAFFGIAALGNFAVGKQDGFSLTFPAVAALTLLVLALVMVGVRAVLRRVWKRVADLLAQAKGVMARTAAARGWGDGHITDLTLAAVSGRPVRIEAVLHHADGTLRYVGMTGTTAEGHTSWTVADMILS